MNKWNSSANSLLYTWWNIRIPTVCTAEPKSMTVFPDCSYMGSKFSVNLHTVITAAEYLEVWKIC